MRATRLLLLAGVGILLSGCGVAALSAAGFAVDVVTGGAGIYQRFEDRQAQIDQTNEIKQLRLEINALRKDGLFRPFVCAQGVGLDEPSAWFCTAVMGKVGSTRLEEKKP